MCDGQVARDLLKNTRDVGGGLLAGTAGAPVDILTMLMRPAGYKVPDERVIGSSEHLGGLMGVDTKSLPYMVGSMLPTDAGDAMKYAGMLGPTVFHGTRATIPDGALRGPLGGKKIMDGLGPHVGTSEAANERLLTFAGLPKNAFDKPPLQGSTKAMQQERALEGANILKYDLEPSKQFLKKDGAPYTESQLQSRLTSIAEGLGFKGRTNSRDAQLAVRKHLLDQGYDAIPYINSVEDRGSVSWVVLKPDLLRGIPDK